MASAFSANSGIGYSSGNDWCGICATENYAIARSRPASFSVEFDIQPILAEKSFLPSDRKWGAVVGFSRVLGSTIGSTAAASAVNPLAERSLLIAQLLSAIPVAVAPIPSRNLRLVKSLIIFFSLSYQS